MDRRWEWIKAGRREGVTASSEQKEGLMDEWRGPGGEREQGQRGGRRRREAEIGGRPDERPGKGEAGPERWSKWPGGVCKDKTRRAVCPTVALRAARAFLSPAQAPRRARSAPGLPHRGETGGSRF